MNKWWSQLKTAGSAIYANRHYLELYKEKHPERLQMCETNKCTIYSDVHIDTTASIHPTAVVYMFLKEIIRLFLDLMYIFTDRTEC